MPQGEKNNGQFPNNSFANSKSDQNLISNAAEQGNFSRRVSTPELLRHVAAVANIKVNTYNVGP